MKDIKNVLICGLGAIGSIYANILQEQVNLKILVDEKRFERYRNNPLIFNGKELHFDYILPSYPNFKADLIIIATKYDGLLDAIKNIENFICNDTIVMSLLNGVTSEEFIAQKYGYDKILYSYFIGHSSVRNGRSITHDGTNTIVFGSPNPNKNLIRVKEFFDKTSIHYEIPEDIIYSIWLKYMLNVSCNQISAIKKYTFGDILNNKKCMELVINVMKEVQTLAKAEGVKNTENMLNDASKALNTMNPDGKTSMLQDILAGRKTEVEIFAGTVVELGKKHKIPTPLNDYLKIYIELLEWKKPIPYNVSKVFDLI